MLARVSIAADTIGPHPVAGDSARTSHPTPWGTRRAGALSSPVDDHAAYRGTVQADPAEDPHPGLCPRLLDKYCPHAGLMEVSTELLFRGRGRVLERCDGRWQASGRGKRPVDEAAADPEVEVRIRLEQHPGVPAVRHDHHGLARAQVVPVEAGADEGRQGIGRAGGLRPDRGRNDIPP